MRQGYSAWFAIQLAKRKAAMSNPIALWEPPQGASIHLTEPIVVREFRIVPWCIEHSSNGCGPSPRGEVCHYSALRQATDMGLDQLAECVFAEKLMEI